MSAARLSKSDTGYPRVFIREDTRSSASATAPLGESTKRDCTDSHCFEKRIRSIGSRSRMLSFSTRSWRSTSFVSAFRSDPCCCTARSYSGPNFCRRPAVVLLRFRTYSQASTAMVTITAPASIIYFGSRRYSFIETSLQQECSHDQYGYEVHSGVTTSVSNIEIRKTVQN